MELKHLNVADLRITNWGASLGGEHFSGVLIYSPRGKTEWKDRVEKDIEYVMSGSDARAFCRKAEVAGMYKAGEMQTRYWTKEKLIQDVIKAAESITDIDLILQGSTCQPCPVIYSRFGCPILGEVGEEFEALYKHTTDPWAKFPEKTKELEDKWNFLLQQLDSLAGLEHSQKAAPSSKRAAVKGSSRKR